MKACIRSVVWMESAAVLKTFSGLLDERERWFLVNDWSSITRRFRRIPQYLFGHSCVSGGAHFEVGQNCTRACDRLSSVFVRCLVNY